jgi:hypothetical protein
MAEELKVDFEKAKGPEKVDIQFIRNWGEQRRGELDEELSRKGFHNLNQRPEWLRFLEERLN